MTERELFLASLELDPAQRVAYLDTACGTDLALRQRLDKLLKAHGKVHSFLEKPAHDLDQGTGEFHENGRSAARIGRASWIGPYRYMASKVNSRSFCAEEFLFVTIVTTGID